MHGGNRAVSPTDEGTAVPARAEASTQTELQMLDAALQVPGCRKYQGPLFEARAYNPLVCRRCAVMKELCCTWRMYGRK